MERRDKVNYYLDLAEMVSQRSTCLRKHYGAVIVNNDEQYFPVSRKFTVKAVEDVSFYINPGETYGLVGESGSGKTTIGRALIRLYDPTAGQITFDGMDISGKMSRQTEARLRSDMQMIFQDPMA